MTLTLKPLTELGIVVNLHPPAGEPGSRYLAVRERCNHEQAYWAAVQERLAHPDDNIEIWPLDADLRTVVREVQR